jgi:hypothetical protein
MIDYDWQQSLAAAMPGIIPNKTDKKARQIAICIAFTSNCNVWMTIPVVLNGLLMAYQWLENWVKKAIERLEAFDKGNHWVGLNI